ncbi:unnamed protein product [Chrysoparadoxa australica]
MPIISMRLHITWPSSSSSYCRLPSGPEEPMHGPFQFQVWSSRIEQLHPHPHPYPYWKMTELVGSVAGESRVCISLSFS